MATEERCYAGHYCTAGATTPTQNECPPGHYCPLGSSDKTACPEGTYNEGYGGEALAACKSCPAGVQCLGTGLAYAPIFLSDLSPSDWSTICSDPSSGSPHDPASGLPACPTGITTCGAGYYCPKGTGGSTVSVKACERGYKCPGYRTLITCEEGLYQDLTQ